MLCGAAPTCTFPYSWSLLSSWDGLQLLGHGCRHETVKRPHKSKRNWNGCMGETIAWASNITFHMYMESVVSSLPLFCGGEGWRSSRPLAARHCRKKGPYFRKQVSILHYNILKIWTLQPTFEQSASDFHRRHPVSAFHKRQGALHSGEDSKV